MIAAELRGGSKPSLNEALGWIGSRVDDIYGAGVGRLDDVWIDPGTGSPRWLLVVEGRFGGRSTLIPFEDATAGAGHVWVPYERDVVRSAPEVQPGAPLTQDLETALRAHYAASAPRSATRPAATAQGSRAQDDGTATIRFGGLGEEPSEPHGHRSAAATPERRAPAAVPHSEAPPRMPERPAPPVEVPPSREAPPSPPREYAPTPIPEPERPRHRHEDDLVYRRDAGTPERPPASSAPRDPFRSDAPGPERDPYRYAPDPEPDPESPRAEDDPAQAHVDALRDLAGAGGSHVVEIELTGELSIRGELRSIKVTPQQRRPGR